MTFFLIEKNSRSFYYFLTTLIDCCLTFPAFNNTVVFKKKKTFSKAVFYLFFNVVNIRSKTLSLFSSKLSFAIIRNTN